jgi:hypothetical protein
MEAKFTMLPLPFFAICRANSSIGITVPMVLIFSTPSKASISI